MQNTMHTAEIIVESVKKVGIDKNKRVNLFVFDDKNEIKKVDKINGLSISGGIGGTVVVHEDTKLSQVNCYFKKGGTVIIDKSKYPILELSLYLNHEKCVFYSGKDFSCVSAKCYLYEGKGIYIGDENLWSFGIQVRNSDAHSIIDINSGECINYGNDIVIGKNVWVASNCIILKGAGIKDNSVIGAGSVITKKIAEENCVIAGNPAKIIRSGVVWDKMAPDFSKKNIVTNRVSKKNMKIVAIMPIKLNNERCPGKNTRLLGGKPLLTYELENLKKTKKCNDIYVYCSDEKIEEYLPEGIKFLKRPSFLDLPSSNFTQIFENFISEVDADIYVYAHATAPYISVQTMESCINAVVSGEYDSAFCALKLQDYLWNDKGPINFDATNLPRTQDLPIIYQETSGVYVIKKEDFINHRRRIGLKPFIKEVSFKESIDIDTESDFKLAEAINDLDLEGLDK